MINLFESIDLKLRYRPVRWSHNRSGLSWWDQLILMSSGQHLLFWQRRPSGKQSLPVPSSGSLPQSLGNISSCPVACGDSVPSSTNWNESSQDDLIHHHQQQLTLCPWSCPMIMCITPCMKGWKTLLLKFWIGWTKGWNAWPNPNPEIIIKWSDPPK